ncbi:histone-lysine N-methyltransferase SETMAR [Trichonephila clavipes]|nr:histone-lysine N-methyltransferase SETMAR [Trichonephila clavipes]
MIFIQKFAITCRVGLWNKQMPYFSSVSDEGSCDLKTTKEIPVVFKYRSSVHVEASWLHEAVRGCMEKVVTVEALGYSSNEAIKDDLAQIKDELDSVYRDSTPSFTTMKFWAAEFKRGRKSLGDDERLGRPNTATTDKNIAKVHQMMLDDHRIKVREIAEVMNMSKERVCHILNQHLGMRNLSARWVPRFLT